MQWAKMIVGSVVAGALNMFSGSALAQMVIIPQEKIQEAANPTTITNSPMHFAEGESVSLGTISEDCGEWTTAIRWSSSKPLTITHIKTSCGCLSANWSRREATSATEGTIELTYHPKGRAGSVEQRAFVYTTLSDEKPTAIVRLVGRVEPSADHTLHYPHRAGTLGLRTKSIVMPTEGGKMEIAVMNCGSEPLKARHDERLSLGGVRAKTKPAVLQAGEEGVLVVEYIPDNNPPILYLGGVNAPPRERKIEIRNE